MSILAIAAHPDDEVLGCGATLARHAADGDQVEVLTLGEGATSRFENLHAADPRAVAALAEDGRKTGRIPGVGRVIPKAFPDNRFDTVPLLEIVKALEKVVAEFSHDIAHARHGGDLNIDHSPVFRATLTATRPQAGSPVREVLAFEVPSSTEWAFRRFAPSFRPSVFVDVTSTLDTKIAAMERYAGEIREFPHPRSPEALRALAARWGACAGVAAAEAFEIVHLLR